MDSRSGTVVEDMEALVPCVREEYIVMEKSRESFKYLIKEVIKLCM